jgi:hypothetical protein
MGKRPKESRTKIKSVAGRLIHVKDKKIRIGILKFSMY